MRAQIGGGGFFGAVGKRKIASERGASMVEFSMALLIITFVLFLLIEFSFWVYSYNVMADAAKAGVRYAIVHGSNSKFPSGPGNVGKVQEEVQKWAKFSVYSTSNISVTVTYLDGTNGAPNRVQVKVANPTTPFFSTLWSTAPVTATAEGRIVY